MPRFFTVEEANRTLPLVRRIVSDITSSYSELMERIEEYKTLDPHSPDSRSRREELDVDIREFTDRVHGFVTELEEIGAVFKGFDQGLVDFHGMLEGRPVFLCWKLGEESIEWWHELDAGFAGRKRLPAHLLSTGGN